MCDLQKYTVPPGHSQLSCEMMQSWEWPGQLETNKSCVATQISMNKFTCTSASFLMQSSCSRIPPDLLLWAAVKDKLNQWLWLINCTEFVTNWIRLNTGWPAWAHPLGRAALIWETERVLLLTQLSMNPVGTIHVLTSLIIVCLRLL